MRISKSMLITLGISALLISWAGLAHAQFPVTDPSSIAQAVKANVNYLQQLKQVQAAAGSSEGISAAIGKATSSFSEYTGQLEEQKAKLEAKKAKYEKRKAQLEKRKAQLEAAKKKVEDAKKKAEGYKDKFDSYKDTVDNAVNTVKTAGAAIDAAKSGDFEGALQQAKEVKKGVDSTVSETVYHSVTAKDNFNQMKSDVKSTTQGFGQEMKNVSEEQNKKIEAADQKYQQEKSEYKEIKKENEGFRKRPNLSLAPLDNLSGRAVYASSEVLMFGQAGVYTGTTETNVFIFPDALAEFCEINAEDVKEEGVMSKCLYKLLELKNSEDMALKQKAVDICRLAHQQFVVAGIEEAILAKKNLYNFEKDTLPSLMEKSKSANDERLLFGSLSAIDTENVNLLNSMAMNYATQSMLSAFKDFCDLEVQQETDIDN